MSNIQAIFGSLDLIKKKKISICSGREYLFSGKTMIFSLIYDKMPPPLLFRSILWGTEKPFIKNWIDGKVLSNLVSDNTKISTYCATETSRIQTEHHKHFFFLTSYSFTKVWIPQSYFYLIIRFLSPYQNSYFTKLQVTLQFLWQAAYTQYKQ